MANLVSYRFESPVATITMDDGKVNALSLDMLGQLDAAFDRAQDDGAVVVLTGRAGVFSGGFDLAVLRAGGPDATAMLRAGFDLAERILSFPLPVVVACPGHAVAMGVFLLLSGDHRLGADGAFRLTANEVAIGLTMPRAAIEICRQRLSPAAFNRAVILAEVFAPREASAAGFLDEVVPADELAQVAQARAEAAALLDLDAHAATKLRARQLTLDALRVVHDADQADFASASA
jgi:enoyl-CoA hydratase